MADVVADCSLCLPLLYATEQRAIQQVLGCSGSNAVIAVSPASTWFADRHCWERAELRLHGIHVM